MPHPATSSLTLIGLAILMPTLLPAQPPMSSSLTGVWTAVSATIDGRPLADDTVKQLKLTLTADRYKSERAGQVLFDSTYKVDATKDPPHIDMIGVEGELKDKSAPGIYKLDGDTLTLCYVMPGKPRPTTFASQPNSAAFLVVYRRAQ